MEFEVKFRLIPDRLYTAEARKIADKKMIFMEEFYAQLRKDLLGDT